MARTATLEEMIIELLAIKLYEHDHPHHPPTDTIQPSWKELDDEDKYEYRRMARTYKPFETYRDEE